VLSALAVLLLRVWHPVTSAFMLEEKSAASAAGERHYQTHYEWVDYARIAPSAPLAVIASEDQQFPFHHGFDVNSIHAAEVNNAEGGRLHGASTISQQLAKNLYLSPSRDPVRKLRELIIAAQDTGHWSVAGTPEQIADAIEERFNAGVLDVISLGGIADDQQHEFAVNGLLADLRKRGLVNGGYQGTTLRENLGLPVETLRPDYGPVSIRRRQSSK